jgi:hypothetical protein
LPTTSGPVQRQPTDQLQAEALAKTGKTASAGAIWLNTSGDVLNSWTVLEARRIQRAALQKKVDDKEQRRQEAEEEMLEDAQAVYFKFCTHGEKKLNNADLKALVKFVVHLEGRDDKSKISQYNNRTKMLQRLQQCDVPWTNYFKQSDSSDDESSNDEESDGGDTSDDEEVLVGNASGGEEASEHELEDGESANDDSSYDE